MLIYFEDYHHSGCSKVVEATEEEWEALIAPCFSNGKCLPIDGSTVDPDMRDELYGNRKEKDISMSELKKIEHIVPMV